MCLTPAGLFGWDCRGLGLKLDVSVLSVHAGKEELGQWRRQDLEPGGTAWMFTKTNRNHINFYKNIINWKTEATRYTTACGKMCRVLAITTSLPLPTAHWKKCK